MHAEMHVITAGRNSGSNWPVVAGVTRARGGWTRGVVVAIVSAGCLLLASRPQAAELPRQDEAEVVEFELLRSLHMAVQVKFNGAGPYRLIFDLGSPVMLVSGRAAAEAGLISAERATKPAFFGMRGEGTVKEMQIGELVVRDVPVMIMDHPTIKMAAEFLGPIDGIVGYPFFARYKFTIDYPAEKMTFRPNSYEPQNVMQQMMTRMFSGNRKALVGPPSLWGLRVTKAEDDTLPGVAVTHVFPSSAAESAGIKTGDRLLLIDSRWTDSVTDAADAASFIKWGETAKVVVRRGERELELEVTPRIGL